MVKARTSLETRDAGLPASAEGWFARLRGSPSEHERAAFERWRADPGNAYAYAELERSWDQSKFLAQSQVAQRRDLSRARSRVPRLGVAAAAGIVVLLAAGALAVLGERSPGTPPAARVEIASGGDAIRFFSLADGSRITLDRQSVLEVRFASKVRSLRLLRGRARFDVAHDPARPFIVAAGTGSVVAVGTLFDVALAGKQVRVVLLRGAVDVRPAASGGEGGALRLRPGEAITLAGGGIVAPVPAPRAGLAWASPMIGFDNMGLASAVAEFNRTSPRPVCVGPGTGDMRISGTFRRDDPELFAQAIAVTLDLSVRADTGQEILIERRHPKMP
jgi:transmembrane sensor